MSFHLDQKLYPVLEASNIDVNPVDLDPHEIFRVTGPGRILTVDVSQGNTETNPKNVQISLVIVDENTNVTITTGTITLQNATDYFLWGFRNVNGAVLEFDPGGFSLINALYPLSFKESFYIVVRFVSALGTAQECTVHVEYEVYK